MDFFIRLTVEFDKNDDEIYSIVSTATMQSSLRIFLLFRKTHQSFYFAKNLMKLHCQNSFLLSIYKLKNQIYQNRITFQFVRYFFYLNHILRFRNYRNFFLLLKSELKHRCFFIASKKIYFIYFFNFIFFLLFFDKCKNNRFLIR